MFIEVTNQSDNKKFTINTDHILEFKPNENNPIRCMIVIWAPNGFSTAHYVTEPYEEVKRLMRAILSMDCLPRKISAD